MVNKSNKLSRYQPSHVKTGDKVKILSGAYKSKTGNIIFLDKKKQLAVIDSLSFAARLKKESAAKNSTATVKTIPIMIALSNLKAISNIGVAT